jgi:hypothetical protein
VANGFHGSHSEWERIRETAEDSRSCFAGVRPEALPRAGVEYAKLAGPLLQLGDPSRQVDSGLPRERRIPDLNALDIGIRSPCSGSLLEARDAGESSADRGLGGAPA